MERSNRKFHCRRLARACGLRPLCFRTVRSRALPGKRLCLSSRLLSFPSSGSMDSCNRDIVQYRPGGCSCKFRSPIRDLANVPVTRQNIHLIALPSSADRSAPPLRIHLINQDVALSFTTVSAKPVRSTVNSRTVAISRRTQTLPSLSKWKPCSHLGQDGHVPPWN